MLTPGAELTAVGTAIGLSTTAGCRLVGTTVTSLGFNQVSDGSCDLSGNGGVADAPDPQLASLAANGGPTPTRLPAADSPLIDAIPAGDCIASAPTDQRGDARPSGPGCDVGVVGLASNQVGGGSTDSGPGAGTDPETGSGEATGHETASGELARTGAGSTWTLTLFGTVLILLGATALRRSRHLGSAP